MNNNISFKSNINFVSARKFLRQFKKGEYIDFLNSGKEITFAPEFYTMTVKTCTAGGALTPHKNVLGFHFNDQIPLKVSTGMKGKSEEYERGLIIGAKKAKGYIYSLPNFIKMREFLSERLQHLSVFERHRYPYSFSNLHYSLETDTWSVNTQFGNLKRWYDVINLKRLLMAFDKIKIAQGDRLFINGKEILSEDFPILFEGAFKGGKISKFFHNIIIKYIQNSRI